MRHAIVLLTFFPGTVFAHVGHIGEVAGHDHIIIGAAIGAIALAGILGALKGRDKDDDNAPEDDELQEA